MTMPRRLVSYACTATVICAVGCSATTTVGPFAVEVPRGWDHQHDEEGDLELENADATWSWLLMTFTPQAGEPTSLEAIGRELARVLIEDGVDVGTSRAELVVSDFERWSNGALEGVYADGTMTLDAFSIEMWMVVARASGHYLVALGLRAPHASAADDDEADALLRSLRIAG